MVLGVRERGKDVHREQFRHARYDYLSCYLFFWFFGLTLTFYLLPLYTIKKKERKKGTSLQRTDEIWLLSSSSFFSSTNNANLNNFLEQK